MSDIVNLNKARKLRDRARKKAQAAENSVTFGMSKAQKKAQATRADKAARDLDGKKREP